MKRLFTYISMLVLAVACETMYGPVQTPIKGDKAGSITVTVDEVKDNSVTFTVTPASESAYYSYMVQAGNEAAEVDATTLYSNGYKKAAGVVASASVKWTAEKSSTTVTVSSLASNTIYQIYAVAGSPMGFAGEVVNTSFKTSDTVTPAYKNIESEEDVITVEFSENVTYNEGSDPIKITYYAPYSAAFKTAATPAGSVDVPAESVEVAGTEATITVPEIPTGSYYTIAIPEGAFVDVVGLELPAYSSTMEIVDTEDGPVPSPTGFYGEISYVELPAFGDFELESFSDWTDVFIIPFDFKYPVANYSAKKFVTVTYKSVTSSSVKSVVHTLEPGANYGLTSLGFAVALPEEPDYGSTVTISIPAGCVYDIYGNDCEAWETSLIYSYGYTIDDIVGTYSGAGLSYFDNQAHVTDMVIVESDDPKKGNVKITRFDGFPCTSGVYGNFDFVSGKLSIPDFQLMFTHASAGRVYFAVNTNSAEPVVFNVLEPGSISSPSLWFGVYLADLGGWQSLYTDCVLKRETASDASTTSAVDFKAKSAEGLLK